ncbi:hypothetical protein LSH36_489g00052 [Paralvinella palmiformis]|uniref:Uncharacterized protein n=1 Tax=Paralvinella palmiformis TaxID=53620 RepID=A0AAD9J9H2_9ANNE|nr:hypothetical protein LSH36_489g00052 [Paralvinella palmiformis]
MSFQTTSRSHFRSSGNKRRSKTKVENRDGEIDRLTQMLEGGRPYDVVALESRNRSNERLISHLNIQIDYLQQKNQDLQHNLDKALATINLTTSEKTHCDSRNKELSSELQDVDYLAKQLQAEKDTAIRAADREIAEAKLGLEKSRRELETMDLDVAQLRAEKEQLAADSTDLKMKLESEKVDRQRLEELVLKVQEDKKRLGHRINKLIANEKDMVLEIDCLKHRNGVVRKHGKATNRMDQLIRSLEEERDYWKSEVEVLQRLMKSRPSSRQSSRASSPTRSKSRTGTPTKTKSRSSSPSNTSKSDLMNSGQFESILHLLEEERDHYKRECEILKAIKSRPSSPTRSASRSSDELTRLRREVVRSPKSPKTSLAAQAVLRRVENERDDAIADLRRLTTERDTLRERLKIATDTQLADRGRLEQRIEDLEVALRTVESERDALSDHVQGLQRFIESLEHQLKDEAHQLSEARDEAAQNKATATQMRHLTEQAERSLQDAQKHLSRRESDLEISSDHIHQLEVRIADLQHTSLADQDEIRRLRNTIASLDQEKDNLAMGVDEKTERIVTLEQDLSVKRLNQELTDAMEEKETFRAQVQDYIVEVKRVEELLSAKEQERTDLLDQYRSLTLEAERYETQTHQLESEGSNMRLELMTRDSEIRRLREKIDSMDRQIQQHLHTESAYENQVAGLTRSVATLEESFKAAENEKHSIMQDLQAVRDLCARLEATKDNLQRQLTVKTLELEKLQTRIDDLKYELETLHAQVSTERTSVKNLEGLLQTTREKDFVNQMTTQERETELQLLRDRLALHESKIDSQNREITTMRGRTIELESELERLRRQLTSERFDKERAIQELRRHGITAPGDSSLPLSGTVSPINRSRSPGRQSPFSKSANDDPLTSNKTEKRPYSRQYDRW